MTDDDPLDSTELAALARRGRAELDAFDRSTADDIWAGIQARLGPTTTTVDAAAPPGHAAPRAWWPAAAAAAVALVVGVATGGLLAGRSADTAPTTLATIELAPLTDDVTAATAALRDGPDGRTIAVDLSDLGPTEGFHEVWLLDPESGALVSLGPVRADGTYVVPDTVDLVELPVLDVSVEPQDGDPTHSGASVLRGAVTWLG